LEKRLKEKNKECAFDDNRDCELPRHGYERMDKIQAYLVNVGYIV